MFRVCAVHERDRRADPAGPEARPSGPGGDLEPGAPLQPVAASTATRSRPTSTSRASSRRRRCSRVMDDLQAFGVPVLILSGGEPLLRPDIFDIAARAKALRLLRRPLHQRHADRRRARRAHRRDSASTTSASASTAAARRTTASAASRARFDELDRRRARCRDRGIKVGLRFTLTEANAADLPALLRPARRRSGIDKFYLSHLNYAGRGNVNRKQDAFRQTTREAMDLLFDAALARSSATAVRARLRHRQQRRRRRVLPALGAAERFPEKAAHLRREARRSGAATPPA